MIFRKLALFAVHRSKFILCAWLIVLAVCLPFAVKLPDVLKDHGLRTDGSYAKVQRAIASDFHLSEAPVVLLFEKQPQVASNPFHDFISRTLSSMQEIEGIGAVVSPLNREGMEKANAAYALLSFRQKPYEMKHVIEQLRSRLVQEKGMTVRMTGDSIVQEDVNRTSRIDLQKAETLGLPVAFVILWLAFGGVVSALIPVLVGTIAVTCAMGIMTILGGRFDLSVFVLNVIPMIGLSLCIDFALMVVSRFREELRHAAPEEAMAVTLNTSGRAIVFSALCVLLGLAGTFWIRMPMFQSLAIGAILVTVLSLLLSLTFVPALLVLMQSRIHRESRFGQDAAALTAGRNGFWPRLSAFVIRRPVRMCGLAVMVLSCCLIPLMRMDVAIPDAKSLPQNVESRKAAERFEQLFMPTYVSQAYVLVEGSGAAPSLQKNEWEQVRQLVWKLQNDPLVIRVDSIFGRSGLPADRLYEAWQDPVVRDQNAPMFQPYVTDRRMLISVILRGEADSGAVMRWVRTFDEAQSFPGLVLAVGGRAKYQQEVFDEIFNNIKYVLLFLIVSNFTVLFVAFRSILIPLKTIAMNLLSLGASFGILVWLFQGGRLGLEPTPIAIMIPVFLAGLTFGISMDYGVFLLSRIYELYRRTGDNDRSVSEALGVTGKIITSAAAIMIAVTAPFALAGVSGVKQLGIGIAAALAIDATIVRMLLVPSLMKLLGKWNWWAPGGR